MEENSNTQRTPYLFTAKELDEETGLYYFGARYYDPRTSVWQSPDPILGKYLSEEGPAGGLQAPINFSLYTYGRNSPVVYRDPDGRFVFLIPLVIKGVAVGAALYGAYETGHAIGTSVYQVSTGEKTVNEAAKEGAINVGTNVAITVTGTRALKVAGKLVPESVKQKAVDTVKQAFDKKVQISRSKHPDVADHIADAQKAGKPDILTIDRPGAPGNRAESLAGHEKVPGKHLDEYPPAMFKEGGAGASVRAVDPAQNMGAGACIGNACRGLPEGAKVKIEVTE